MQKITLTMVSENIYEIPKEEKMLVPCRIFASPVLLKDIKKDKTLEQIKNVAELSGIIKYSLAMPDAHQGYGFSIGGVAAFDLKNGIVSPGGVGYDINCGVRLLTTNILKSEFLVLRDSILNELFKNIPSGVGHGHKSKLSENDLFDVLKEGSYWAFKKGYATKEDIENTEDKGKLKNAAPNKVSQKAKARGRDQLGTLGAGNHFLEIQEIQEIYEKEIAKIFGLDINNITIMIHTGSRGLGHQTASDYILKMEKEYGFSHLPDRELICAPINSTLGEDYLQAMAASANFAFANRQLITYYVRESFKKYFPKSEIKLVYDVAHNIAKIEKHLINGKEQNICVHRKGATRSFGPGRDDLPKEYKKIGQPVLIPGSMGTFSYILVGTKKAEEISFASTAHGAGRVFSRSYAKSNLSLAEIKQNLKEKNIKIKVVSEKGIAEEAPEAYKDVNEVVRVSHELGIGNLVAKLKPLAVMKG